MAYESSRLPSPRRERCGAAALLRRNRRGFDGRPDSGFGNTGFQAGRELLKDVDSRDVAYCQFSRCSSRCSSRCTSRCAGCPQSADPVAVKTKIPIPVGTDITFTNKGVLPHDFTVDSPALHSGTLGAGDTATPKVNVSARMPGWTPTIVPKSAVAGPEWLALRPPGKSPSPRHDRSSNAPEHSSGDAERD